VLAELPDSKGKYLVIDGKQRLLTLNKFALDKNDPLKLIDLQYRKDLNGLNFSGIENGESLPSDLSSFENSPIRTTVVRGWKDEEVLYLIFYRLNSGSVPLSPQELRHVLHPGPFMDFAFDFAEKSETFIELLGKDGKPDFRMRDVEMLIRFLGFKYFLGDYDGNLKSFLDSTAGKLNIDWKKKSTEIESDAKSCERAIKTTEELFKENAFVKWTGEGPENRFNRAVFDVMCFYFSNASIAKAALKNQEKITNDYKELCIHDEEFRRSIETTTKSIDATRTRLISWGKTLQKTIEIPQDLLKKAHSVGR
jgi:hypothetical protein